MISEDIESMNIHEKVMSIRKKIAETEIPKSGKNKHDGYEYHELEDIEPIINRLCHEYNIYTQFSFTRDNAIFSLMNLDNPTEIIDTNSPMASVDLNKAIINVNEKGIGRKIFRVLTNAVQGIGAMETYQRRYIYMSYFQISEDCIIDSQKADENEPKTKNNSSKNKKTESKKTTLSVDDQDVLNFYDSLCEESENNDTNAIWLLAKKREKTDPEGVSKELLTGLRKHLQTLGGK